MPDRPRCGICPIAPRVCSFQPTGAYAIRCPVTQAVRSPADACNCTTADLALHVARICRAIGLSVLDLCARLLRKD